MRRRSGAAAPKAGAHAAHHARPVDLVRVQFLEEDGDPDSRHKLRSQEAWRVTPTVRAPSERKGMIFPIALVAACERTYLRGSLALFKDLDIWLCDFQR